MHRLIIIWILIPNENRDAMNKIFNELKASEGNWKMLDYNRLTFKALEKLALLRSSTFEIADQELQEEAKKIWEEYKEKAYKDFKE